MISELLWRLLKPSECIWKYIVYWFTETLYLWKPDVKYIICVTRLGLPTYIEQSRSSGFFFSWSNYDAVSVGSTCANIFQKLDLIENLVKIEKSSYTSLAQTSVKSNATVWVISIIHLSFDGRGDRGRCLFFFIIFGTKKKLFYTLYFIQKQNQTIKHTWTKK